LASDYTYTYVPEVMYVFDHQRLQNVFYFHRHLRTSKFGLTEQDLHVSASR